MARVLSNETSLSRQQKRMRSETKALRYVMWGEAGLAALLALVGVVSVLRGAGTGWFWAAAVAGFFAYSHFMKLRQNARDEKYMAAGLRGESEVAKILTENLDNSHYLYNDITVRSGFARAQIDHIVVSKKGIFVLETKNWRGRLEGDEGDRKWFQHVHADQPPRALSNPILQNQRHVAVLEKYLRSSGAPPMPIIPILVFTGRNTTLDIRNQKSLLLWPRETVDAILRHRVENEATEADVDAVLNRMQRFV
ncbi:MAG: NERD domain-containing protein [Kiritimatiellae bacterium]|nr:NERD domain-containing protein [Kiritimatiellia bacterium]